MIKKHTTLMYYLFVVGLNLCCLSSCTYDYFEDETNYAVYVPKADRTNMNDDYRVEDVRLLIYQDQLKHDTKISFPFDRNARTRVGNFNFKLYPRMHSVYCLANTQGIEVFDIDSYTNAGFGLMKSESNSYTYSDDLSNFHAEYKSPYIDFPGPKITDTAPFDKRYVGKICFAFKNIQINGQPISYNEVANIYVEALGVGNYQKLELLTDSINTRSSRYTQYDRVELNAKPYLEPLLDFGLGFHCYFFPSLGDETDNGISLKIELQNSAGQSMYSLNINITDLLHMNETIFQAIDGNKVYKLTMDSPEDWNSDIETEDDTTPGGGGIEM